VKVPGFRRADQAGRCPTVRNGVVSPAGVKVINKAAVDVTKSAPDDHLTASPNGGVIVPSKRRIGGAGFCPTICTRIVLPTGVKVTAKVLPTPNNHLTAAPDCGVIHSDGGRVNGARCCPAICGGIIAPTGVKIGGALSAPDNHFAAGPDGRMIIPRFGGVGGARCRPAVCRGVVSTARVKQAATASSAPHNHLSAGQ